MHFVCEYGYLELAKYFASLNIIDIKENTFEGTETALHFACGSGNIELVKYLVSKDILNTKDSDI